jgi:hypothetical protein
MKQIIFTINLLCYISKQLILDTFFPDYPAKGVVLKYGKSVRNA